MFGKVYFVGAGPGEEGLLTIRGAELLQAADVVLFDGLASEDFQKWAKVGAEWISVGKHGSKRIWKQDEINEEIVRFAKLGKNVVRLKGGDTGVFARTAEELERMVLEGIPFEVVPGITTALAAAAYTGIPITHRDWASAVALVTGQMQPTDGGPEADESIDWGSLAKFPGTLVIYMGVTSAGQWSRALMNAGKSGETPVALVRRCSWPDQSVVLCKLSEVADRLTPPSQFRPPVISIVGPVAALGGRYNWFEKRPLFGKSILIARSESQLEEWKSNLANLGARVICQSAIEITPISVEEKEPLEANPAGISSLSIIQVTDRIKKSIRETERSPWNWVVFTSKNGVNQFMQLLWASGLDGRAFYGAKLAAVGPSVQQALHDWKLKCDLLPDDNFNAHSLADAIINDPRNDQASLTDTRPGSLQIGNVLLVEGSRNLPTLANRLKAVSALVDSVCVYRSDDVTSPSPEVLNQLRSQKIDYCIISSGAIGRSLAKMFGDDLRKTKLVTISANVSKIMQEMGFEVWREARVATLDSVVESIGEE